MKNIVFIFSLVSLIYVSDAVSEDGYIDEDYKLLLEAIDKAPRETIMKLEERDNENMKRAEAGDPAAMFEVFSGLNPYASSREEASKWLHKSAELGYPEAQRLLGIYYCQGRPELNIYPDYEKSKILLKKAMDSGDQVAPLYYQDLITYKAEGFSTPEC